MTRSSSMLRRSLAAVVLGGAVALAGCHGNVRQEVAKVQEQGQFDLTMQAYKGGQFMVDGAVLSALDTGSHFAYLKDQDQLPKTVLLVPSDDAKIKKAHLQFLARMMLDYGFTAFYDKGGELKQINPVETKTRKLEDYHAPVQMNDELQGKSASSGGFDPQGH